MPRPTPTGFGPIKARPPYAAPGQAIGLLGGSFNPPHVAHLMISEAALKRLGLDKVWWVVSPGNPLKRRVGTMPLGDRMALCREVAKNPHIVVTDFEKDLQAPYTATAPSCVVCLGRGGPPGVSRGHDSLPAPFSLSSCHH